MMRVAGVAVCVVGGLLAAAGPVRAQSAGSDEPRSYGEFNVGATFGHKTSGSIAGEGGYRVSGPYVVFGEVGHMFNVGTQDLDDRAGIIAGSVGATADTAYRVTFFDAGLRYELKNVIESMHPYVAVGFGVASVKAETTLLVNGAAVPPESLGVQFGDDLNGTVSKALLTIGGGVTYPFMQKYFVDGALRYGYIFPRSGVIENDKGINTIRLQVGAGIRF